ncbi:hypothetical protein RQP46_011221 [Phenoliferia psychrophenolica]
MAANPPAALLAFPNEVLDEILGHLVSCLPPEPSGAQRKSLKLQALETVSLVSKQWRAVALRRLVSKLVVRTGSMVRAITKCFESGETGDMLRELRLDGYLSGMSLAVPTAQEIAKKDWIAPNDIVALLHLTPHLKVLYLHHPAFVRFRQRDLTALSTLPFVATLETLTIASYGFDRNCELMSTVVPLFPAIRSLEISVLWLSKNPRITSAPSKHPFLSALHLSGATSIPTLFSLIDITASARLEEIHLFLNGQPNELDRLFKAHLPATVSALRLPMGEGYCCERLEEALRFTPKPPGLLRIELLPEVPGLPAIGDEMKTMLEGHGLRVVCLE